MRNFLFVSYMTQTKYIEGINWLCPGVADILNQIICSDEQVSLSQTEVPDRGQMQTMQLT